MHARRRIREKFFEIISLIPNLTTFNGRVFPLHDAVLPAATIFTRDEVISPDDGRLEGLQHRTLATTVQLYVKADQLVDDAMDNLAELIEAAVMVDQSLLNLVRCLDLVTVEIEVTMDGENPMGTLTMVFSCRYLTNDGFPGVIV